MQALRYNEFRIDLSSDGPAGPWSVAVSGAQIGARRPLSVPAPSGELVALARQLIDKSLPAAQLPTLAGWLAQTIFPDKVAQLLRECYCVLGPGEGLRIRLVHHTADTATLPWEFALVDLGPGIAQGYLATIENVSIVRQNATETNFLRRPPRADRLLRVVMAAAPNVHGRPSLPELDRPPSDELFDDVQREWVADVTTDALDEALAAGADVFEFDGHCDDVPGIGQALLLAGPEDEPPLTGTALGAKLVAARVRVALINACRSGHRDAPNASTATLRCIVEDLLAAGVPAVIGMQHDIENGHALRFTSAFYPALLDGLSIEEAVSRGRRHMHELNLLTEFGVPVLYCASESDLVLSSDEFSADHHDLPDAERRLRRLANRVSGDDRVLHGDPAVRAAFARRLLAESTTDYRSNLVSACAIALDRRPEPPAGERVAELGARLLAEGNVPPEQLDYLLDDAPAGAVRLLLEPGVWEACRRSLREKALRRAADLVASGGPMRELVLRRLLDRRAGDAVGQAERSLVEQVFSRAPLSALQEVDAPLDLRGEHLVSDLQSADHRRHDTAVRMLLENPGLAFGPSTEGRLGAALLQRAVERGLMNGKPEHWRAASELLTVPFIRCWSIDRLVAALARVLVDPHGRLRASLGVPGTRLLAGAATTGRLAELLAAARAALHENLAVAEPARATAVGDELRDCAALVRDRDGLLADFADGLLELATNRQEGP